LLERFVVHHDQDAFACLVGRHGPFVLGLCRRVLADAQDAEDAFQATFLVLARKAPGLRRPAALAAWLHGVALRIARKARGRRPTAQPLTTERSDPHPDPLDVLSSRELLIILDEEVRRLPEAFRLPIVLCYLQGRTAAEAARVLGWTSGSVRGRLERGRARLQQRLMRRGLGVSAALVSTAIGVSPATAAVSGELMRAAAQMGAAALHAAPPTVTKRILKLAELGAPPAIASRLKAVAVALLLVGTVTAGAGVLPLGPVEAPPTAQAPRVAASSSAPRALRDLYDDPLPQGAIARLGTLRLRHSFTTAGIVFSPDGKRMATLGGNSSGRPLVVWDPNSGRQLFDLPVPDSATAALFTPDGKGLLVATHRHGVYRWDAVGGKQNSHILDIGSCGCGSFTPDGRLLVVSDYSKSIRLFDLDAGKPVRDMVGDKSDAEIISVAITPDGKIIASGGRDGTVRLWDPQTGGAIREWRPFEEWTGALGFSPEGKWLASGTYGKLHVAEVKTGKSLWSRDFDKKARVGALRFSPDGKTLAAGAGGSVRLFHALDGKEMRRWDEFALAATGLAFTSDGKTLAATGFLRSAARLYHVASGKPLGTEAGHAAAPQVLRFAADGKTLTSVGLDGSRYRWDLATSRADSAVKEFHKSGWTARVLSPDGKVLATAEAGEDRVLLWDFETGKELGVLAGPGLGGGDGAVLAFSPDNRVLAVGPPEGSVQLWDIPGRRELRKLESPEGGAGSMAFSPDGKTLATAVRSVSRVPPIRLWDVATGKLLRRLDGPRWNCQIAFSPDGKYLAAGGTDDHGKLLVRPIDGQSVWLWETAGWERHKYLCGHTRGVMALAFSRDSKRLATGGLEGDDKVRVWDVETVKLLHCFQGHHSCVYSLAFSPDSKVLASGAGDSTILLWDTTTK
jgi:RNA polymerase sigma factor (sigma-70 family)